MKQLKKTAKPWWKWVSKTNLEMNKRRLREMNQCHVKDNTIPEIDINMVESVLPKFSVPSIYVITATPFGSLREQKKLNQVPEVPVENVNPAKEECNTLKEIPVSNVGNEVDNGPCNMEQKMIKGPEDKLEGNTQKVSNIVYEEYEPIRRLSADIREGKISNLYDVAKNDERIECHVSQDSKVEDITGVENSNKLVASLPALTEDDSRRFSKLAPAPADSPHAKQVGTFSVIPTEKKKSIRQLEDVSINVPLDMETIVIKLSDQIPSAVKPEPKPIASLSVLSDEASRKFSQLAPAPTDSPHSKQIGTFSVIPTEKKKSLPQCSIGLDENEGKSS